MRISTLMILGGGVLAAMTFEWSVLRTCRTLGDVYREARAGRIHSTLYSRITTLASLILIVAGTGMAIAGD